MRSALLLLLLTVGFYWKILSKQYTRLDQPDLVNQVLPWLQVQARQWHDGHFPLWDPHLWAGHPIPGQVQTGTLNPFNWILFSMPLRNGFLSEGTVNWYYVLIHYLAALFAYLLCRDRGLSRPAAILAGCGFGLGGFVGATAWPQILWTAVWLPLILLFLLRVLEGRRPLASGALAGTFLGLAFLGGHHNVPMFAALLALGIWVYYFFQPGFELRRALPVAAFAACAGLIAAAQILPAAEFGQYALRWVNAPEPVGWKDRVPYSVHQNFSLYPTAVLGLVVPGVEAHSNPFIGLVVLSLAVLGLALSWGKLPVRVLAAGAAGSLLFALGSATVFHGWLYTLVPGLDKARNPSMAIALFHACTAALAAYGFDAARGPSPRTSQFGRALLALGAVLYAALGLLMAVRAEKSAEYKSLALTALVSLLLGALYLMWSRRVALLLIPLALFELHNVSTFSYLPRTQPTTLLHRLYENRDIVQFLKQRPEPVRVDVDDRELPFSFGSWFGVDQLGGSPPAALRHIISVHHDPQARKLLANNYTIARQPLREGQVLVFEGSSGLKVFHNPGVNARVWAERAQACGADTLALTSYQPARIVLAAELACPATVVFSEAWYPGWRATVDGRAAPVERVHNMLRGVKADTGKHEIVLTYRPLSVYLGGVLAVLGVLLCLALQFPKASGLGG